MSKKKTGKRKIKKSPLRDIASIRELSSSSASMKAIKEIMPILEPIFEGSGVDFNKLQASLEPVDYLAKQTEELISLPDRFNNFFADHGWIMYGMMSVEVAKLAVEKAESGDFKGAEEILLAYYNIETVSFQLRRLRSIKAFQSRMDLALKALKDYEEERYHACIPVVLALTDGLVNELHGDHKGISAETTELEAWDSIAAHSKGLGKIVRILRKGRRKTTTDKISLPYRNGILHGTDLGYDNKVVAAKTWATLFSVGEWALKVERGEQEAPEEKPQKALSEILTSIQESEKFKQEIRNWKPRETISFNPDLFCKNSPEYVLNEFLSYWMQKNYGKMVGILPRKIFEPKKAPARIREHYSDKVLKTFEYISIVDVALSNTTIEVKLQLEELGEVKERVHKFIMINEDEQGHPVSVSKENSKWITYTWLV